MPDLAETSCIFLPLPAGQGRCRPKPCFPGGRIGLVLTNSQALTSYWRPVLQRVTRRRSGTAARGARFSVTPIPPASSMGPPGSRVSALASAVCERARRSIGDFVADARPSFLQSSGSLPSLDDPRVALGESEKPDAA